MALKRLSLTRGDSTTYNITFKNAAGVAYCIKNWKVFFTLKKTWELPDSSADLQKTISIFTDTTSGTSGVAIIPLYPYDTIDMTPGEYDFDIAVCTEKNESYTIMKGKFDLGYDVTRTSGTAGTTA